jgi:hypothetical protein
MTVIALLLAIDSLGFKSRKTVLSSIFQVATATFLVACEPSQRLPVTGDVKLEFIGKDATDIRFRLRNQTSNQISFLGTRDLWWSDVFPYGPRFECVLVNGQMHDSPFPLIDGPAWKHFVVASSGQIDIGVSDHYLKGRDGRLPTGRCKFLLELKGGAVVESEEFESLAASSSE